jgi:pyridoxine kinase
MNVLSIQSHVAYGHVGNAAAVFCLQRLGFDVWPVHTVQFSNHTGYPGWRGQVFEADHITELVEGLGALDILADCDAVLSGYLGDAELGGTILDTVTSIREANPKVVFACDPVMGDVGTGLYVRPGIPEFMSRHAVPAADIVTPNLFELELLTGARIDTLGDAVDAARRLMERGPKVVLVTSLTHPGIEDDSIEMLVVTGEGAWRIATPRLTLDLAPHGAGDAVASLFLANYLKSRDPAKALARSAAAIYGVLKATAGAGATELRLIANEDLLVEPRETFPVEKLE